MDRFYREKRKNLSFSFLKMYFDYNLDYLVSILMLSNYQSLIETFNFSESFSLQSALFLFKHPENNQPIRGWNQHVLSFDWLTPVVIIIAPERNLRDVDVVKLNKDNIP